MTITHTRRIRIREVVDHLGASSETLAQLRAEGLFEDEDIAPHEAEELRVATVLVEQLGVNPAGVQVALHLRRRLFALEARVATLASRLDGDRGAEGADREPRDR